MRDYRIQITDLSTGNSQVQGYDRAAIARLTADLINSTATQKARYIGRKGSKMSRSLDLPPMIGGAVQS